jgi:hypothetical protein
MFFIDLDLGPLQDILDLGDVAQGELARAAADLTAQTKGKVTEIANEKLHSRRGMYLDALSHFQVDENTWVVNLDKKARWIDDGMRERNMLESLLKSKKAKRAKDGSTYVVVPFQHNQTKQNMTPAQQSLLNTIKTELAKVDATPTKIETNADGSPKMGLVRSLDIINKPPSTARSPLGRGIGGVAQGPTGIPLLQGVRVYQNEIKKPDGTKGVGRFVMTFRVASSKHKDQIGRGTTEAWRKKNPGKSGGQARWQHPGVEATNIMEEGLRWALDRWEQKIAPALMARIVAKLS